MSGVTFPQPMVEAPDRAETYYFVDCNNEVDDTNFAPLNSGDIKRLATGNVYATHAEAKQRAAWNAQEMARLVMPPWFRKLGTDVEFKSGDKWKPWKMPCPHGFDWSDALPELFRAKPRDVVVTVIVEGVARDYKWPSEVAENSHIWLHRAIEKLATLKAAGGDK